MKDTTKLFIVSILISMVSVWGSPCYAKSNKITKTLGSKPEHHLVEYNHLNHKYHAKLTEEKTSSPWAAMIAIGAGVMPKYPGSNVMIGGGALAFSASYKNRIFINSAQGVGVNFINTKPLTLGASVTYSSGNDFRSREFSGLQNPPDMYVGSLFANYTRSFYNFGLAVYKPINKLQGAAYYQAMLTRVLPMTNRLVVNLGITTQYDSASYMQAIYGVNSSEALNSGLSIYNTNSGWDNISYAITPIYSINKHWLITGSVTGVSYLNQVAHSPLLRNKQNYSATLGVIYKIF